MAPTVDQIAHHISSTRDEKVAPSDMHGWDSRGLIVLSSSAVSSSETMGQGDRLLSILRTKNRREQGPLDERLLWTKFQGEARCLAPSLMYRSLEESRQQTGEMRHKVLSHLPLKRQGARSLVDLTRACDESADLLLPVLEDLVKEGIVIARRPWWTSSILERKYRRSRKT